jgi:hypothetical protein
MAGEIVPKIAPFSTDGVVMTGTTEYPYTVQQAIGLNTGFVLYAPKLLLSHSEPLVGLNDGSAVRAGVAILPAGVYDLMVSTSWVHTSVDVTAGSIVIRPTIDGTDMGSAGTLTAGAFSSGHHRVTLTFDDFTWAGGPIAARLSVYATGTNALGTASNLWSGWAMQHRQKGV